MVWRMMRRAGALLLGTAFVLPAQFTEVVSTDSAKEIYFISALTLTGSASTNSAPRLYRIGPEGLSMFAEAPTMSGAYTSGTGGIANPQVSADGSLVGFTVTSAVFCVPSAPCTGSPAEAQVRGARTADLGPGFLQLSRNGRWALTMAENSSSLADLTTGVKTAVPTPVSFMRAIASDGSVLVAGGIWKNGQTSAIAFPAGLTYIPQYLSDNAAIVISFAFAKGVADSGRLTATDLASGKTTTLIQSTASTLPLLMGLSNDGRRALYRVTPLAAAAGAAYVVDTTTGQSVAVPLPQGELATDGTLSGDGAVAVLVTTLGRMVKVTIATVATQELIPPTVYFNNVSSVGIGSLAHLQTTFVGTVTDWTGRILIGDTPLPIVGVKPGEVDVQIPWEQPTGVATLRSTTLTATPFRQSHEVFVSPIAPRFEPLDAGQSAILPIKIVKGDWSGLQTTQPHAGDIVYVYMTGLGAVNGPVQTGAPASTTTLNPLREPLTCTFSPQTTPAETLFAGLAPGFIGVYQVAFRMPADPNPAPMVGMECKLGESASFGFAFGVGGTIP